MKPEMLRDAEKYSKVHRQKRLWYRVVTCLAAVVVFCTTYALILPAITLEHTSCGVQEHTHTEDCYTQVTSVTVKEPACTVPVHQHAQDCYDDNGQLICGYADYVVHTHDANCYNEDGTLWCTLPQIKAHTHTADCYAVPETEEQEVHTHTEACYTLECGELICSLSESEGHSHGSDCYTETRTLACGQEESEGHTHEADCYTTTRVLVCQQEESEGHAHGEGCSDENGTLVCKLEESEGHIHGEGCYEERQELACGLEESQGHTHDDTCYATNTELTCGLTEEPAHTHTDECYEWNKVLTCTESTEPVETEAPQPELVCGKREILLHEHTASCYDEYGNLICGMQQVLAHQHTDACFTTTEQAADTESLTCTNTEETHIHTALCYGTWNLTCTLPEHTHTEECYASEEEAEDYPVMLLMDDEELVPLDNDDDSTENDPESAEDETNGDLSSFLTNVVIRDADNNPVSVLHKGESYTIYLSFAENTNQQFLREMTYQLPDGILITSEIAGTLSTSSAVVADYTVSTDGLLTVTFRKVTTNEEEGTEEWWQETVSNGAITVAISAQVSDEASNTEIHFSDELSYDVEVPQPELDVSKSGSFTQGEADEDGKITTGTAAYTVTVTAKNGDVSGLSVTDAFSSATEGAYALDAASITVTDSSGNAVASDYYTVLENADGLGFTIQFSPDYTLEAGSSLNIHYNVDVTGLSADNNVGFTQNNKVTVMGTSGDSIPVEDDAQAWTWISVNNAVQKFINKYGTAVITPDNAAEGADTGTIVWTVNITDGNGLGGATVTDTLGEGLAWDGNPIILQITDVNGVMHSVTLEQDAIISGSDGTVLTFTLPTLTGEDGAEIKYTSASLSYTTTYDLSDVPVNGSTGYTNTVEVTGDENGENVPGGSGAVRIPGVTTNPTTTTKNVAVNGSNSSLLDYAITIDVPYVEGGYQPFYVVDTISIKPNNQFHYTKLKLTAACITGLTVTADGDTMEDIHYEVRSDGSLYIYFNSDNVEESQFVPEKDTTIQITYSVDLEELELANSDLVLDNLSSGGILRNSAVNHFFERTSSAETDYKEAASVIKTGVINDDGTITYTVDLVGLDSVTRAEIANALDASFIDVLPNDWVYVKESFKAYPRYSNGPMLNWEFTCNDGSVQVGNGNLSVLLRDLTSGADNVQSLIGKESETSLNGFRFVYTLAFNGNLDDYNKVTVQNSAYVKWDGHSTNTASFALDYGLNPLDKSVSQDTTQGNKFHFTIKVNQLGDQLLAVDAPLTLTDTMSSNLALDIGSLKVVKVVTDGTGTEQHEEITGWSCDYTTGADSSILTISGLPDETYLIITYDAYVNQTGHVSFNNLVELTGKSAWKDAVEDWQGSIESSGSASGGTGKFYIHKVDSGTGVSLSGAVFELYLVGSNPLGDELIKETEIELDGSKTEIVVDGQTFSYWYNLSNTYTRIWELDNRPGWFQVGSKRKDNQETQFAVDMFAEDGYYFVLIETKAPEGYQLLSEPIAFQYGANYDVNYAGTFTVGNEKIPVDEDTSVTVEKVWKDAKGNVLTEDLPESISFELYQVACNANSGSTYQITGWSSELESGTIPYSAGTAVRLTVHADEIYSVVYGSETLSGSNGIYEFTVASSTELIVHVGSSSAASCTFEALPLEGTGIKYGETYTLPDEAGNWTMTIEALPKQRVVTKDDGTYDITTYSYYIKEVSVIKEGVDVSGDYTASYSTDSTVTGGTITITNIKPCVDYTSVTVNKQWQSSDGDTLTSDLPSSISLQLYQVTGAAISGDPDAEVTYTLNDQWGGSGNGSLEGIRIGDQIEIKVTCTQSVQYLNASIAFTGGLSNSEGGSWNEDYTVWTCRGSVTTPNISISISGIGVSDISSIEAEKVSGGSGTDWGGEAYGDSVAIYPDSNGNWSYTFENLPATIINADGTIQSYTYYVIESTVPGYTTSYSTDESGPVGPNGVITVTNKLQPDENLTSITVNKQWFRADGITDITSTKGGSISFDLYQIASTTSPGESGSGGETNGVSWSLKGNRPDENPETGTLSGVSVGDKIILSLNMRYSGSGWMTISWEGVSDGSGSWNGSTYEYSCTVTSKVISITVNDSVACLGTVSCNVTESSGNNDESTTPAGTKIDTYTISKEEDWTWSKGTLPLTGTDEDGNTIYYTYYVVEHNGTNYSTDYENNGGIASGTIIIKNTELDNPTITLPDTGGRGTTLYTLGGLLLMIAAGYFLLYNHTKRRKEDYPSS